MRNLLREEDKKIVRKEYTLRVIIVALALVFTATLINGAFLLPSYFLIQSKEQNARRHREMAEQLVGLREKNTAASALSETKEIISILSLNESHIQLKDIFEIIVESKPDGVSLNGMFYEKQGSKNIITITGIALGRENLLSFNKRLEREALFQNVALPISNLASDKNIKFSIRVTGVW
jgi:hypothetical protein